MVGLPGFRGLKHQIGLVAHPRRNQPFDHCPHCQQHGHRRPLGVHAAIAQNQNGAAFFDGFGALAHDPVQGIEQTTPAASAVPVARGSDVEERRDRGGLEIGRRNLLELFELFVEQNRRLQADHPGVVRSLDQHRVARSQVQVERHHQRFAQRINRRVRNLREHLPKVLAEGPRPM